MKHEPDFSSPYIFIRGIMPRSGTNFIADALSCHPAVCRDPGGFWEFSPFRAQPSLDKYLDKIEGSKHASEFRAKEFFPYIGEAWGRFLSCPPHAEVMLLKEPSVDYLDAMIGMFPRSKVLFMVRDGRDIVSSLLKAGFGFPRFSILNRHHWRRMLPGEDFRILCRQLAAAGKKLNMFLQSSFVKENPGQFRVVCFEALFENTEETVRDLLTWSGLDLGCYDWERLQSMPVRGSSFLRESTGKMNFEKGVARPSDFNPVGRSTSWTNRQRAYYEKTAGAEMKSFGYDPEA